MRKVDVAIIGGGSAGLTAYWEAIKTGCSAVLINEGEDGTTCARVGCMPSKALIQIAQDFNRTRTFTERGITGTESLKVHFPQIMEHVRSLRDHFVEGIIDKIKHVKDNYLKGRAKIISLNQIEINNEIIETKRIILATGSHPHIPKEWNEFSSFILTSDNFFELTELPQSLAIIGLGPVGLEIGLALSQLGVKIVGFSQNESLGGLSDPEVNDVAKKIIENEFPVILNEKINISKENDQLIIAANDKKYTFDKVLITTGRRPNLNNLGLEKLDLTYDEKGIPVFNPNTMQIEGTPIFLAGDITAEKAILPQALDEGFIAGYNASHQIEQSFVRRVDLYITFTDPTICVIGQNYSSLNKEEVIYGKAQFENQGRALIMGKNHGLIKIYGEPLSGKILGAELICPEGEHLAHLLAFCVQQQLTATEALKLPFYHPVIEESLITAFKDLASKIKTKEKNSLNRLEIIANNQADSKQKIKRYFATASDNPTLFEKGEFSSSSQDIGTREMRNTSLQNIMSILAHQKFPANKEELIKCAKEKNAEKEVIDFIQKLPNKRYMELSSILSIENPA